jgi:hypothetical protein
MLQGQQSSTLVTAISHARFTITLPDDQIIHTCYEILSSPSPEPVRDLAVPIAAEPSNAGRHLHSNRRPRRWALQCHGIFLPPDYWWWKNCSPPCHLLAGLAEPLPLSQLDRQTESSQALSSLRGAFLFMAAASASQYNSTSWWSGCLPPLRASLSVNPH